MLSLPHPADQLRKGAARKILCAASRPVKGPAEKPQNILVRRQIPGLVLAAVENSLQGFQRRRILRLMQIRRIAERLNDLGQATRSQLHPAGIKQSAGPAFRKSRHLFWRQRQAVAGRPAVCFH